MFMTLVQIDEIRLVLLVQFYGLNERHRFLNKQSFLYLLFVATH